MSFNRALIAAAVLGGAMPFDSNAHGVIPPPNGYKSTRKGSRTHTAQDDRAKAKKVAKRRAKKGYR